MVLKKKLWVFLKLPQPKIIVSKDVSTMYMPAKRNQGNQEKNSKENIIKNARNHSKRKKKKWNETIKDRIIRDYKKLFEQNEDYCKLVRRGNFYGNYIE